MSAHTDHVDHTDHTDWEDVEEEYGEREELAHRLDHDSDQSDDEQPMFSVVGQLYYDPNTEKFSYYDGDTGRVVKLSW